MAAEISWSLHLGTDEDRSLKYVTAIIEQMIYREMFSSVIAVDTNTAPSKVTHRNSPGFYV